MRTEKDPPKKNSPRNHFKARLEYDHDDGATVIQPFFVFFKRNKRLDRHISELIFRGRAAPHMCLSGVSKAVRTL